MAKTGTPSDPQLPSLEGAPTWALEQAMTLARAQAAAAQKEQQQQQAMEPAAPLPKLRELTQAQRRALAWESFES